MLAETRRREIADRLRTTGAVTVAELEERFGVSPMTARRDLAELERRGVVRRTHGGAVLPTISAHEDSFARRLDVGAEEKVRLAEAAVGLLTPARDDLPGLLDDDVLRRAAAGGDGDGGHRADQLAARAWSCCSSEGAPALEVIGIGGTLRRLTRSFVGPFAVRTVQGHFADRLFLSVKGIAANGMLTDADPLEAELKRTMIEQAGESVLLIDHTKLSVRGLSVIAPIAEVATTIATGLDEAQADALRLGGRPCSAPEAAAQAVERAPLQQRERDQHRCVAITTAARIGPQSALILADEAGRPRPAPSPSRSRRDTGAGSGSRSR